MARRRALSNAEVAGMVEEGSDRPLGIIYLVDSGPDPNWKCTAFVLRSRSGGFMVALPLDDRVTSLLQELASDDGDGVIFREMQVDAETPRRRAVGAINLVLADVPWPRLSCFQRATPGQSGPVLIPMTSEDGTVVRPVKSAAIGSGR